LRPLIGYMALPKGWKKKETKSLTTYESSDYLIYVWKKEGYDVEAFKKGSGYKTRLFARKFSSVRDATKFVNSLTKQKRIMKYQSYNPIMD
jgi:hypothetical protein